MNDLSADYVRLAGDHQRTVDRHRRLFELTSAVYQNQDLSEVLKLVRAAVVEGCGFDRAGIFLYDERKGLFTGTWGTDVHGELESLWGFEVPVDDDLSPCLDPNGPGYKLNHYDQQGPREGLPDEMADLADHGAIFLRSSGVPVGFISIDNLFSGRPITDADIRESLPFAEQAAAAIMRVRMLAERDLLVKQQRRLMQLAVAISANQNLDEIFRLVRDAVPELGSIERAGVWVIDGDVVRGTWGTDDQGNPADEHDQNFPVSAVEKAYPDLFTGKAPFIIRDIPIVICQSGEEKRNVAQAIIALRAGGELVGLLTADTLLTHRRVRPEDVAPLLPFCEQVSIAIVKSRLLEEKGRIVEQQRRLMEIAVAITANQDPDMVFRLVRDSILEMGVVDRAAVWIVNGDVAEGTWGTDTEGNVRDEHELSFSLEEYQKGLIESLLQDQAFLLDRTIVTSPTTGRRVENVPHAIIPLRTAGELVGILTVDTFLTGRPLNYENLAPIQPIAELAAIAVQKARLLDVQDRMLTRQRQLMQMAVAMTAYQDPDLVYRLVRDSVIEAGDVDRAGVWIVEGDHMRGTWGTGMDREVVDEHDLTMGAEALDFLMGKFQPADSQFVIGPFDTGLCVRDRPDGTSTNAMIAIRSADELVGLLMIDNQISGRLIDAQVVEPLLPFTEQAAVAVQNSRLLVALEVELERRRLAEERLVQQTHELIATRDEALAATRAKSEFVANMSHEIRTPMNGVIGMTSLLLNTPLNAQQLNYTLSVRKSADALLTIIEDVLDFSKIEAGKLEIDLYPFNLRECLDDVAEMMAARMEDQDVELNCIFPADLPEWFVGDRGRIRQMLTNLVGNAVKFTEHGEVVIQVAPGEQSATRVSLRLEVSDTGIGIAEDRLTAIFESFTQADGSTTRKHGGTGLGLTITKQIVELMGGSIGVRSQVGRGSVFSVEFSLGRVADSAVPTEGKATGKRILLVDPNSRSRQSVLNQLAFWGNQVSDAGSSAEAVSLVEQGSFDLVLMDSHVVAAAGNELVLRLSDLGLPIVLLQTPFARKRKFGSEIPGLVSYLNKPFRTSHLREAIVSASGLSRPSGSTQPIEPAENLGLSVLVAEDTEVNMLVARARLEIWGCEVTSVRTGVEALEALSRRKFDLVLMDVSMPEMDGLQATRIFRGRERGADTRTPIIAMTAHVVQGDRQRCLDAGMDDYVSKPLRLEALLAKLRYWGHPAGIAVKP